MLEDIISRISAEAGIGEEEIRSLIEEKQAELSDLISEEGAAYMVAKELGISLLRPIERLKIKNIAPGMKNVDVVGKVVRASEREFSTEKSSGRVKNIIIADDTGSVRISLWNDEIENYEISEGDFVRVHGYAKADNVGEPELRLGYYGSIKKVESEPMEIATVDRRHDRVNIATLKEGMMKEVRAAIMQVFESNVFYEVCPFCGSRVKAENNFACEDHGAVKPNYSMVISGVIDDGTGNMRAVMFGENAEALLGLKSSEAREMFDRKKSIAAVLENITLGKEFIFEGKVRKNSFFNRSEFIINSVKSVHVKKEIDMLLEKMNRD